MASSSGTSGSDEEEHHNTWDMLLERGIYDLELCRVALSCHDALDVLYIYIYRDINIFFNAHGVTSRGATVIRPKQSMCAACYVYVVINTGSTFTGLVMKTGKDRLGPSTLVEFRASCEKLDSAVCLGDRFVLQDFPECPHQHHHQGDLVPLVSCIVHALLCPL